MRRFLETLLFLTFICLSWYGAEMLIYQYCQPSIIKALVCVLISLSLSGRAEKEYQRRIENEKER